MSRTFKQVSWGILTGAILGCVVLALTLNLWLSNLSYSWILSFAITSNIAWLVVFYKSVFTKKPHRVDEQNYQQQTIQNKHSKKRITSPLGPSPKKEANPFVDSKKDSSQFTLGALASESARPIFATPKSIQTHSYSNLSAAVSKSKDTHVSIESAFRRGTRPIQQVKLDNIRARFDTVCRILKQANLEVAVWTESEIATLANSQLTVNSEDKDMIALLLPPSILRINTDRTFEYEYHGQLLSSIVFSTGVEFDLRFVSSSKDYDSGKCVVDFTYSGKSFNWRFIEADDVLSEKYLNNALNWVSKRAKGKFLLLNSNRRQRSYVFVLNRVLTLLNESETATP